MCYSTKKKKKLKISQKQNDYDDCKESDEYVIISFEQVLGDTLLLVAFREYIHQRESGENLAFWLETGKT